jgi:hypothetical protein
MFVSFGLLLLNVVLERALRGVALLLGLKVLLFPMVFVKLCTGLWSVVGSSLGDLRR